MANANRIIFDLHKNGDALIWMHDNAEVTFDMNAIPGFANAPEFLRKCAIHGVKQKIADAGALSYVQPDGSVRRPTVAEKFAEMQAVADRLACGEWNAERGETQTGLTFEAVKRYQAERGKELTPEKWASLTKEQRASIGKLPGVLEHIAAIRAERAKPEDVAAAAGMLEDL